MRKNIFLIVLCIFVIFFLAAAGLLPCGVKLVFGIPCPTCGMTRAFFSLLHADFKSAFYWHPLFALLPLCFFSFLFIKSSRKRIIMLLGCALLLVSVYAIRMFLFFPNTPPMDFSENAIMVKIFERIFKQ